MKHHSVSSAPAAWRVVLAAAACQKKSSGQLLQQLTSSNACTAWALVSHYMTCSAVLNASWSDLNMLHHRSSPGPSCHRGLQAQGASQLQPYSRAATCTIEATAATSTPRWEDAADTESAAAPAPQYGWTGLCWNPATDAAAAGVGRWRVAAGPRHAHAAETRSANVAGRKSRRVSAEVLGIEMKWAGDVGCSRCI
jgi:hypothetical protein